VTQHVNPQLDAFQRALSETIRARRTELGLSLVEVANRAGLSHAFISQLERSKSRASMRSLFAIAQALATTQESLIAAASSGAPGADPSVELAGSSTSRARLILHANEIDVTELSALPFAGGAFFEHERPELTYVVSGQIELETRSSADTATTTRVLAAGEAATCPGGEQHRYRSLGAVPATVLMIHYPAGPARAE